MLTIHLLTHNNEKTLATCLDSLQPLKSTILVGDFGSTDNTLSICKQCNIKIIQLPRENNYAKSRNDLISITSTNWQLWLEPWERLEVGHDQILWALQQKEDAYNVYNVQGNLIQKQTRLWRTNTRHFVRPVYESLEPETNGPLLNCVIAGTPASQFAENMAILTTWRKQQPHVAEVDYYLACTYVCAGRYDEFLQAAERFLFRNSSVSVANIMTNYYYALVQLLVRKNTVECIKHVTHCLVQEPTLAEFWCLLGDAFFKMQQYHRAAAFYDNAIIFGSRRLQNDAYPIEINKYKEHPERMLNVCREIHR